MTWTTSNGIWLASSLFPVTKLYSVASGFVRIDEKEEEEAFWNDGRGIFVSRVSVWKNFWEERKETSRLGLFFLEIERIPSNLLFDSTNSKFEKFFRIMDNGAKTRATIRVALSNPAKASPILRRFCVRWIMRREGRRETSEGTFNIPSGVDLHSEKRLILASALFLPREASRSRWKRDYLVDDFAPTPHPRFSVIECISSPTIPGIIGVINVGVEQRWTRFPAGILRYMEIASPPTEKNFFPIG